MPIRTYHAHGGRRKNDPYVVADDRSTRRTRAEGTRVGRETTITQEFWKDARVMTLSRSARLLYLGLDTLGDRFGCIDADPVFLKGALFVSDDDLGAEDIEGLVRELTSKGLVLPAGDPEAEKGRLFVRGPVVSSKKTT